MRLPPTAAASVMRRAVLTAIGCASLATVTACTEVVADTSACKKLEYKDGSVARAQYLPCAAEMIAALDDLDRETKAALEGDSQARTNGWSTLRRVNALMSAAGGRQLLERWDDRALTSLNMKMSNAVTKYQAFYMVRLLDDSNQFAKKARAAATAEYEGGNRHYEEARQLFNRLK